MPIEAPFLHLNRQPIVQDETPKRELVPAIETDQSQSLVTGDGLFPAATDQFRRMKKSAQPTGDALQPPLPPDQL